MITLNIAIAGVSFRLEQFRGAQVAVRDDVSFVPEPDNKFDANAVKVMKGDAHIGYVPKDHCSFFKELLSKNAIKSARINKAWSRGANVEVSYER